MNVGAYAAGFLRMSARGSPPNAAAGTPIVRGDATFAAGRDGPPQHRPLASAGMAVPKTNTRMPVWRFRRWNAAARPSRRGVGVCGWGPGDADGAGEMAPVQIGDVANKIKRNDNTAKI